MKDRNTPAIDGTHRATARTRRLLTTLLCGSLAMSIAPRAFAEKAREGRDGNTGDKDGDGKSGNRDGRDRSRSTGGDIDAGNRAPSGSRSQPLQDDDRQTAGPAPSDAGLLPLREVLDRVDQDRYGIVISIDLKQYRGNDIYRMKTRDKAGVIRDLRMDARTGRILNMGGS